MQYGIHIFRELRLSYCCVSNFIKLSSACYGAPWEAFNEFFLIKFKREHSKNHECAEIGRASCRERV